MEVGSDFLWECHFDTATGGFEGAFALGIVAQFGGDASAIGSGFHGAARGADLDAATAGIRIDGAFDVGEGDTATSGARGQVSVDIPGDDTSAAGFGVHIGFATGDFDGAAGSFGFDLACGCAQVDGAAGGARIDFTVEILGGDAAAGSFKVEIEPGRDGDGVFDAVVVEEVFKEVKAGVFGFDANGFAVLGEIDLMFVERLAGLIRGGALEFAQDFDFDLVGIRSENLQGAAIDVHEEGATRCDVEGFVDDVLLRQHGE